MFTKQGKIKKIICMSVIFSLLSCSMPLDLYQFSFLSKYNLAGAYAESFTKEEAEELLASAEDFVESVDRIERPGFFKRHMGKIAAVTAAIIVGGAVVILSGGTGAPAAISGMASAFYSTGAATGAATSAATGAATVATGAAIGVGAAIFLEGKNAVVDYMADRRIIMTDSARTEIKSELEANRYDIVYNSRSKEEAKNKINNIILGVLRNSYLPTY